MPDQPNNMMPSVSAVENSDFERDFQSIYQNAEKQSALDFAASMGSTTDQAAAGFDRAENNTDNQIGKAGIGVGRDVSLGVMQAPRHIIKGARDAIQNILDIGHQLDVATNTPALRITDKDGNFDPGLVWSGDAAKDGLDGVSLPKIDPAAYPTVTGAGIESISKFMAGFGVAGKALKAAGVAAELGGAAGVAKSIGQGALGDMLAFDGHEQRLSNIVQAVPALQNPVTEYLAAQPDDTLAESKFKQGVEGVLTGALGEGLIRGVSALKKLKNADTAIKAEGQTWDNALTTLPVEEQAKVGLEAKNFQFLGNPDSPDFFLPKDKMAQAAEEVQGAFGKTKQLAADAADTIPDYQINFARINGPDDIKQLMDDMVNKPELKISIEAARRGEQSNAQTLLNAQDINGFDSMMERRVGDAFNADQIVAARRVYYDTTDKLMEAARKAAGPEATDIDVFNFRKMVAVHHAVQKEFMGVRAEAGRALQAWSINLGGSPAQNLRLMEQTLADFGGADVGKDLARRLSAVSDLSTDQINAITKGGALARTGKAIEEVWTLGLLTNPQTHIVNLGSNILTTFNLGLERLGMAGIKDSPVTLREGLEFWTSIMESQKMAIKNAAQAFRTGESQFGGLKIENAMVRSSARDILDPEGKAGLASKALDWWGGLLSKYVGGSLLAGDEYNKTILYQAQIRSLAVREAMAQGVDRPQIGRYVADALSNPPERLMADAEMFAKYGTFTRELGQYGQAFQRMVSRVPGARFVVPFIRTPANIFKYTFERTPLAFASSKVREDIAAGGVRRATALTRIGMGSSLMFMANDMALNGKITGSGPTDPATKAALRRTGWQPYSIKIGDGYYSYARFEPLATLLGMAADMSEILSNYEAYDVQAQNEADELVTAGIIAASNQVVGKTFMRGFADLTEALSDPKRYGEQFLSRFAGSFVPAGSAAIERAIDPAQEQVFNMMDSMRSRIPGLSEFVPPRRNIWGEEIKYFHPSEDLIQGTAERAFSLLNPVHYSQDTGSKVDQWLLKNDFDIDMPDKTQVFDGVRIDLRDHPWIYDDLVKERGNGVRLMKYGNQTMKEFFENLATAEDPMGRHIGFYMAIGRDYQDQKNFISGVVRDYTKAAHDVVLDKHADQLLPEIEMRKRDAVRLNEVRGPIGQ
ncbi:MAG: hypothetical protein IAE63_06770 [Alphaproteobacteria bacterium]|nr:hypothetical protein [Alphaproteobacteria bacterium]